MRYILLLLVITASLSASAQVDTLPPLTSVIYGVHDGDSYYFSAALPARRTYRIAGADTPEVFGGYVSATQPLGREVADSVRQIIKGQQVLYNIVGIDKYKRPIVVVYVNGRDLALTILERGWGYAVKTKFLPADINRQYSDAAKGAKKKRLGVYGLKNQVSPAKWRKQHPMPG